MSTVNTTRVTVTEAVNELTVNTAQSVTVNILGDQTELVVNNFALPSGGAASAINFTPYGQLTATNVNQALLQLADLASYAQPNIPTPVGGSTISEGNLWYDTDDNQLKVYRETSTGFFEFVPIIVGNISPDSDTLDAGAF
tara:strand:+ start:1056 stop:1478 length:423 start_codon:yes stop_codon:yes gene_type:complete